MASFIIASIAYSKLDVTNWERYGQRMVEKAFFIGILVWYAVKPRGDIGIHSIEVCWHRRRLGRPQYTV